MPRPRLCTKCLFTTFAMCLWVLFPWCNLRQSSSFLFLLKILLLFSVYWIDPTKVFPARSLTDLKLTRKNRHFFSWVKCIYFNVVNAGVLIIFMVVCGGDGQLQWRMAHDIVLMPPLNGLNTLIIICLCKVQWELRYHCGWELENKVLGYSVFCAHSNVVMYVVVHSKTLCNLFVQFHTYLDYFMLSVLRFSGSEHMHGVINHAFWCRW